MLSRPGIANNSNSSLKPENDDQLTAEAIRGFRGCGVTLRQVARVYGVTVAQLQSILAADERQQAAAKRQRYLAELRDWDAKRTEGRRDG